MRHGSLFSGIGGFDLASEWMGWENVFHCEWKEFNQRVLKYYWPKAISYVDITKTDFNIHRGEIDILTGGFPCQPYSVAGKRKGTEDSRHLWPEMLRAVREIQPSYVVGENVGGLISWSGGLVFDQVQADLEAEGYEVQPFILPACAVNAPHRRDRIWFIAHSNSFRNNTTERTKNGIWEQQSEVEQGDRGIMQVNRLSDEWITSNTNGSGRKELNSSAKSNKKRFDSGDAMHSDSTSKQGQYFGQERQREFNRSDSRVRIGSWENFPTQSPICDGDDGISKRLVSITFPKWRNESIMAGGNAIVPQVAYEIFKAIKQIDKN